VRETALTLLRSHPFAHMTPDKFEHPGARGLEVTWKEGIKSLVMRWMTFPELAAMEAPAVPAPHPDAPPSGAPKGFTGSDLLELKRLVVCLCSRGSQCCLECCDKLHGHSLVEQRVSPWVRDEAGRLLHTHPYDHLLPGDYQLRRCGAMERVWRAGLVRQVERWMEWYDSGERSAQGTQEGPRDTGGRAEGMGVAGGVDSALAASAQDKTRKRPRSPTAYAFGGSSTTGSVTAQETSSSGSGGREGLGPPTLQGRSSGTDREGLGRPALEELLHVPDSMCQHGDGCPSLHLRGQAPCPHLHSADIKALEELPPWARETALTFMGAHPYAKVKQGGQQYDPTNWIKAETAWQLGLKEVVRRRVDKPELTAMEAPAVPALHPDAAPSGAPRGVKRSDLLKLKGLVLRLCICWTQQCPFRATGSCRNLHPGAMTTKASQGSPWARDELERITRNHPYQHLTPGAYQIKRCEPVEQAWKAGLIRQVDKWIEWQTAASTRPKAPARGWGVLGADLGCPVETLPQHWKPASAPAAQAPTPPARAPPRSRPLRVRRAQAAATAGGRGRSRVSAVEGPTRPSQRQGPAGGMPRASGGTQPGSPPLTPAPLEGPASARRGLSWGNSTSWQCTSACKGITALCSATGSPAPPCTRWTWAGGSCLGGCARRP
jgi:hypothetical protein